MLTTKKFYLKVLEDLSNEIDEIIQLEQEHEMFICNEYYGMSDVNAYLQEACDKIEKSIRHFTMKNITSEDLKGK